MFICGNLKKGEVWRGNCWNIVRWCLIKPWTKESVEDVTLERTALKTLGVGGGSHRKSKRGGGNRAGRPKINKVHCMRKGDGAGDSQGRRVFRQEILLTISTTHQIEREVTSIFGKCWWSWWQHLQCWEAHPSSCRTMWNFSLLFTIDYFLIQYNLKPVSPHLTPSSSSPTPLLFKSTPFFSVFHS